MHVALCDDHPIVADGIASLLIDLDGSIRITRYHSASSLLREALDWRDVDLVFLDLLLPDLDGFVALTRLRELREDVPVVVISGAADRFNVRRAIDLGAMGFVPKSSSTALMRHALRRVLDGAIYIPPEDLLVGSGSEEPPEAQLDLTPRQWQILRRVLQGKPIKRIANELAIAESTVKTHITPILRALNATTRTEAIVKAGAIGLKLPPELV